MVFGGFRVRGFRDGAGVGGVGVWEKEGGGGLGDGVGAYI